MSQFRRLEAENEREYGDEFDLIMFLPVMVRLFFFSSAVAGAQAKAQN